MDTGLLTQIAMGIALSACEGFWVFIPMLAAALAGQFGWIHLPPDMQWLGSWPSWRGIVCGRQKRQYPGGLHDERE